MAVLIINNIVTEGPGTIENFLRKEETPFVIVELRSGEIPPHLEDFDTLVIMGGPFHWQVLYHAQFPVLTYGGNIDESLLSKDEFLLVYGPISLSFISRATLATVSSGRAQAGLRVITSLHFVIINFLSRNGMVFDFIAFIQYRHLLMEEISLIHKGLYRNLIYSVMGLAALGNKADDKKHYGND